MEAALKRSNLRLEAVRRFRPAQRILQKRSTTSKSMALFSKKLGIDLGPSILAFVEGGKVILQEPTVAAIVVQEQKMVAWGQEAQYMFGRVPDTLEVTRPLMNGVIADYEVTETCSKTC